MTELVRLKQARVDQQQLAATVQIHVEKMESEIAGWIDTPSLDDTIGARFSDSRRAYGYRTRTNLSCRLYDVSTANRGSANA